MSNSGLGYQDQALQGLLNAKVVEAREFTLVNTTSSTAITAVGTATITVGSATNIAVDQNLTVDTGTNQETVLVTAVSGTSVTAYFTKSHSAGFSVVAKVLRQPCIIADPTTQAAMVGVTAKGVQQPYGLQTVEMNNAGRNLMTLVCDAQTIGSTSETLLSFVQNLGTVATTGNNYTVSTGKTLRIQSVNVMASNTSGTLTPTAVSSSIRMRVNPSGAVTTSSALRASVQTGLISAQSNGNPPFGIAGEMEIPSGWTIGFSRQDTTASLLIVTVSIIGYEF
jgi:hypothetical protein